MPFLIEGLLGAHLTDLTLDELVDAEDVDLVEGFVGGRVRHVEVFGQRLQEISLSLYL